MHRAACGCVSALRGGAEVLGEGVSLCGGGSRSLTENGLWGRRGMHGAACGCASGLRGRAKVFGGEWVMRSAGVRRREEGVKKCSGRACAVRGRAKAFGGEWVVRLAGLTHFRRSSSRVRVLLYIRPPRHRREIKAMGQKRRSRECSSPAKASAPAPSAFIFPCPRSHFRVRVHTSPAWPSAAPAEQSASRSSSYPQWVIHGKVIHIVARRPVQNVLALAPAHAYI